ncbi:MAG TPA: TIGR00282 family metallophosphoesterase [Lachnospiraceae bacterium]|nr:TIGR00282 family metallophosphoesterase [Lachnospiraceae bacterium]
MRILAVGDVVGRPGRRILREMLSNIKRELKIDICIVNGENAATGNGITEKVAREIYSFGADIITLGNHTWSNNAVYNFIDGDECIVRPANFASGLPGKGSTIFYMGSSKVGVINLCGRVYLEAAQCPFESALSEIEKLKDYTDIIIVDFHAEATSEKIAMGWYLDGKVSAVFGTHTHVQTADERILPNGTGFITDIGMTGPYNSVIGIDKDVIIKRFTTEEHAKFLIPEGDMQLNGVYFEIDEKSGKCVRLERIRYFLKG